MKSIEYIYQETEIHFLVHSNDKNVMVNATEMAKAFDKRIDHFTRSEHAKAFMECLEADLKTEAEFPPNGGNSEAKTEAELPPNGGSSDVQIIVYKGHMGTYFHRLLALKFAAWLDPKFELWIYKRIEDVIFGNYKKHWDAHARQEMARMEMDKRKQQLLTTPTAEAAKAYFEAEEEMKRAKSEKGWAIRNQLSLWDTLRDRE